MLIAENLLNKHSLRKTKIRIVILELFLSNNHALSHSDIEDSIGQDYDRVTIYRTFKTFEEQGIIHKVPADSGLAKYAICQDKACVDHKHYDNHVHFTCTQCGNTYCLDQVPIPLIQKPSGFTFESFSFLVQGICKFCH